MLTPENYPIICGHEPIAANVVVATSDSVCLKDAKGVLIIVMESDIGNTDVVLTVNEATTAAGAGTALSVANGQEFQIWQNHNTGVAGVAGTDVLTRAADGITCTMVNDTTTHGIIVCFYISAALLSPGYSWVHLVASGGDATSFMSVLYILDGYRYQQATPLTEIA